MLRNDCGVIGGVQVPKELRQHPQSGLLGTTLSFPLTTWTVFSFSLRRCTCCVCFSLFVLCRLKTQCVRLYPRIGQTLTLFAQIRRKLVIVGDGKSLLLSDVYVAYANSDV